MVWIRVKDGLPNYGERVLFALENGFVGEGYLGHINFNKTWFRNYGEIPVKDFLGEVVAWMPLPKFSKQEGE